MKVVYDISVLGAGHVSAVNRTGVFRATEHLAEGLASSGECALTFSAQSYRAYGFCRAYLESNPRLAGLPLRPPTRARAVRWLGAPVEALDRRRGAGLPVRAARRLLVLALEAAEAGAAVEEHAGADVFHSPYPALPRRRSPGPQRFLTVHDLIPLLFPELFDPHVVRGVREVYRSIGPRDWVLCNSTRTRDDLCEHVGVDPERTVVTHFAASRELFYALEDPDRMADARRRHGIPDGPYVLSLNTLEPRKNVDHAIRAFARLVRQERLNDLNMVLVGTRGWRYGAIFDAVAAAGLPRHRIILAGYVADADLAPLYSGALAFIYPSRYEGFGLPPLEAMQCGAPVVASNTSAIPEVVGDAGILLDPADGDGLSQAILDLYRSPSLRERMRSASIARARGFSWERCTRETLAAYRAALAQ